MAQIRRGLESAFAFFGAGDAFEVRRPPFERIPLAVPDVGNRVWRLRFAFEAARFAEVEESTEIGVRIQRADPLSFVAAQPDLPGFPTRGGTRGDVGVGSEGIDGFAALQPSDLADEGEPRRTGRERVRRRFGVEELDVPRFFGRDELEGTAVGQVLAFVLLTNRRVRAFLRVEVEALVFVADLPPFAFGDDAEVVWDLLQAGQVDGDGLSVLAAARAPLGIGAIKP